MTTHIALHFATEAVPDWVQLTPAGTFSGGDGRGPYRLDDAAAVIARSMKAGKLPIDENHATDLAAPLGQPAPARGWIVEMQSRPDGIHGRVEWTEAGKALLADKAYRGISPVLAHDASGRIVAVLRASLVNDPNLNLKTLHARENTLTLSKTLISALKLKDDADDAAIEAAVKALHASEAQLKADLAAVAKAAGAADGAAGSAIVTALQAKLSAEPDAVKELRGTVTSLQSKLDAQTLAIARDKATAFVDAAIAEGKPIKPLRDHYIERHAKDPASVEKEIGALVSINAGGIVSPPKGDGAGAAAGLTPGEINAKAQAFMKEQAGKGVQIEHHAAVRHVTGT